MLDTLCHQSQHPKPTLVQTKDIISNQGLDNDIPLENGHIYHFRKLFELAFYKLFSIPELKKRFDIENLANDPVRKILDIIDHYKSPFRTTASMKTSNIQKLAWDFFFNYQTDAFFERHFLFGTPSQKQF